MKATQSSERSVDTYFPLDMHGNTAVTTSDPARLHNLPAEHVTNLVSGIVTAVGYRDASYMPTEMGI